MDNPLKAGRLLEARTERLGLTERPNVCNSNPFQHYGVPLAAAQAFSRLLLLPRGI